MVSTDFLNQTVNTQEIQGIYYYLSAIPKYLTEQITGLLVSNNINVTTRWTSTVIAFFSLGMIFLGIKVLQKVNVLIKIILVALFLLILLGIFLPYW